LASAQAGITPLPDFRAFGWDLVRLKHGARQRTAFEEPGGAALRDWIDRCPNQLNSALTFQGGRPGANG